LKKQNAKQQESEAVRLRVKPGDSLSISIHVEAPQGSEQQPPPRAGFFTRLAASIRAFFQRPKVYSFFKMAFSPMGLFVIGCGLYALTRFIRLPDFPIYFASDEATTALRGLDLVRDGGFDYDHYFLPPFFLNDGRYSLGTIVYLQILPLLMLGKSVWVVRGVSALISFLGVIWFSLILRDTFKLKLWWAGAFLIGVIPAWFLFSRTAYAAAEMTALYVGALYYYLRYRSDKPLYLYASVVLAMMAFGAYQPGEVFVVLSVLAFGLFDIRIHIRNWKVALPAVGLLFLLALPIANFYRVHLDSYTGMLQNFNSFLSQDLPVTQKAALLTGNYFKGLSPFYWFSPFIKEEPYYQMKGYSHIPFILVPLAIWGVVRLIKKRSKIEILTVAIPFFAAPVAAALIGIQVTRVLMEIIPYAFLIMLGLEAGADFLENHRVRRSWITLGIVVVFSFGQISLLYDSLTRGPLWWNDYGISGIQWGSNQVFKEALNYSAEHPDTTIYISGGWTFKADGLLLFFVPKDSPVFMGSPDQMPDQIASGEDLTFVVLPEEFTNLQNSGDYLPIQVEKTIPCPDGSPCFRFIKLAFSPQREQNQQARILAESQPVTTTVQWNGKTVDVTHAPLSDGKITNLLDTDMDSFIRSRNVNPLWMEFTFPAAIPLTGVQVRVGSEPIQVVVTVNGDNPSTKQIFTQDAGPSSDLRDVVVDFSGTQEVKTIQIDVKNKLSDQNGMVHVWQLDFLQ
jgi:hypothetical protein